MRTDWPCRLVRSMRRLRSATVECGSRWIGTGSWWCSVPCSVKAVLGSVVFCGLGSRSGMCTALHGTAAAGPRRFAVQCKLLEVMRADGCCAGGALLISNARRQLQAQAMMTPSPARRAQPVQCRDPRRCRPRQPLEASGHPARPPPPPAPAPPPPPAGRSSVRHATTQTMPAYADRPLGRLDLEVRKPLVSE